MQTVQERICKKRTEQKFCSAQCRNAAWKKPRKRRLKGAPRGSVANGPFSSIKTDACKAPSTPDLGAFIRAQIVAQEELNPIGFSLSDGTKGRVWLASDWDHVASLAIATSAGAMSPTPLHDRGHVAHAAS